MVGTSTFLKSMTGRSFPDGTTMRAASNTARLITWSNSAAFCTASNSSGAVMSLMAGCELAASTTEVPRCSSSRASGRMPAGDVSHQGLRLSNTPINATTCQRADTSHHGRLALLAGMAASNTRRCNSAERETWALQSAVPSQTATYGSAAKACAVMTVHAGALT